MKITEFIEELKKKYYSEETGWKEDVDVVLDDCGIYQDIRSVVSYETTYGSVITIHSGEELDEDTFEEVFEEEG